MLVQSRKVLSDSWFQTFALNTYEIIVISFPYHCFWPWNNFQDVVTNRSEFRSPHSSANRFLSSQVSIRDMPIARPVHCIGSCSKWDHTWGGSSSCWGWCYFFFPRKLMWVHIFFSQEWPMRHKIIVPVLAMANCEEAFKVYGYASHSADMHLLRKKRMFNFCCAPFLQFPRTWNSSNLFTVISTRNAVLTAYIQ